MIKILWTQNKNPSTPSSIINSEGKLISIDSSSVEGFDLFDKLLQYEKSCTQVFAGGNLVIKEYQKKVKGLLKKSEIIGCFISSVYTEKDDFGRLMPFMYYTDIVKSDEIILDLKNYSKKINKTMHENDINIIKIYIEKGVDGVNDYYPEEGSNKKNEGRNFKKKTLVIVGTILIILIYILWIKMRIAM